MVPEGWAKMEVHDDFDSMPRPETQVGGPEHRALLDRPVRCAWYPIATTAQFRRKKVLRTHLLGDDIQIRKTDTAEFEGLRAATEGAKPLLVRDYAGLVWVCAAPSADLAPPLVDLGPLADLSPISLVTKPVRSSFDQVVLGLVDPAHVPLVHQSWWWRRSGRPRQIKTKIYAATEYGFTARASAPRKSGPVYAIFGRDLEVNIEFRLPGVRIERIEAGQRKFYNMTCVTPVTNRQCMLLNVIYSNVGALRFLKPAADRVAGIFLQQDRRLLEMLEDASPYFRSMIFVGDPDTPARWYFMLKRELADAQARSRPFRNPVSGGTLRWQT